jgi:hypothetical protein
MYNFMYWSGRKVSDHDFFNMEDKEFEMLWGKFLKDWCGENED